MTILVNADTRVLVQGITGRDGSFHTRQMMSYGTRIVAGVTPGRGGERFDGTVPIYDTVADAVRDTSPNTAVIYVPAGEVHRFTDIAEDLAVVVFFGPAEYSRAAEG